MPLSMFKAGERVRVANIVGTDNLRRHLGSLGFAAGTVVQIVDDAAGGKIVGIQGERLALNADVAMRINCIPV